MPEKCTWSQDGDAVWYASCPPKADHCFCFEDKGPVENGFKFCPFCGLPLVAEPYNPDID